MNKSTVAVTRDADGKPIDLHEPGALEALFEFHRKSYGGWTMVDGDDDDNDDDGGDDDDDASDDDDDDDSDDDNDDDDLTPAQLRAVERAANRIADRRINQLNRRRNRRRTNRRDDDDDDDRRGGNRNRNRNRSRDDDRDDDRETGPTPADTREARLVYRDSIADAITFTTREERQVAGDLARGLISAHLNDGLDVVDAGEQAADDVAKAMRRLRTATRDATIRRLKRDGALPQDFVLKSQPKRGRTRPGQQKPDAKSGKAIAESLYADRLPKKEDQ